jgi:hypothetical protein
VDGTTALEKKLQEFESDTDRLAQQVDKDRARINEYADRFARPMLERISGSFVERLEQQQEMTNQDIQKWVDPLIRYLSSVPQTNGHA